MRKVIKKHWTDLFPLIQFKKRDQIDKFKLRAAVLFAREYPTAEYVTYGYNLRDELINVTAKTDKWQWVTKQYYFKDLCEK